MRRGGNADIVGRECAGWRWGFMDRDRGDPWLLRSAAPRTDERERACAGSMALWKAMQGRFCARDLRGPQISLSTSLGSGGSLSAADRHRSQVAAKDGDKRDYAVTLCNKERIANGEQNEYIASRSHERRTNWGRSAPGIMLNRRLPASPGL